MTTHEAIDIIAHRLRVPAARIGYAGLKDKHAVTHQYVTVRTTVGAFTHAADGCSLDVTPVGKTNRPIGRGDLIANTFELRLQRTGICRSLPARMPNYFGFQRFGRHGDNHETGLHLLRREYGSVIAVFAQRGMTATKITDIPRSHLKFCLHAYQSRIFNAVLREVQNDPSITSIQLPGAGTRLTKRRADVLVHELLARDGIACADFAFRDLRMSVRGALRKTWVDVSDISCREHNGMTELRFTLPAGSYVTSFLEAIGA